MQFSRLHQWRTILNQKNRVLNNSIYTGGNFHQYAKRSFHRNRSRALFPSINSHGLDSTTKIITSKSQYKQSFSSIVPQTNHNLQTTTTSSDGVVARPIDFDVASKVEGEESQIVTVSLEPNQILRAESGAMIYMTQGVQMETTTGGGMSAGFKRMLTGQNIFISDFSYHGEEGTTGQVALGTDFPSKIIKLNVQEYGGKLICQKGALLCASHTIDIEMEFAKKMTAGFFGGEGFVLQALTGEGDVFIKAGGTLVKKVLEEGEILRVSSGSLVAFQQGVEFDVQTMPGFKNVVFGGEGLFVTTLTGPGTVWLQGMPPDKMINEIVRRVPRGGGMPIPIGLGVGGGGDSGEVSESDVADDSNGVGEDVGNDGAMEEAEAAIQADRNATVASSGLADDEDPDSPSALFGDAAPPETENSHNLNESTNEGSDFNESSSFTRDDETFPDFEDTSFSTDDVHQDSAWDSFHEDETSFDTEESSLGIDDDDEDSGSSLLGTLWDLFSGGDD